MKKPKPDLATIRTAIADYILSEGCSCCRGFHHQEHKDKLARLLGISKYKDGFGYNFSKYESRLRKAKVLL